MTQTNGVGVTERSEDWTIRSIFEDWIADRKLSRRKIAFLETIHSQTVNSLNYGSCSPSIAPQWMISELDGDHFIYECQCIAELLDFLKPRGESKQLREHEIFDALDEQALL